MPFLLLSFHILLTEKNSNFPLPLFLSLPEKKLNAKRTNFICLRNNHIPEKISKDKVYMVKVEKSKHLARVSRDEGKEIRNKKKARHGRNDWHDRIA